MTPSALQLGDRITLVDGDLRRPQQHEIFGLGNQRGLTTWLQEETPAPLQKTQVEGLQGREMVTTTFLTIAFAQLWHVFNMRAVASPVFVNEVTRNPWLWAAIALCIVLVALPPYWPPAAEVLRLAPPTANMWVIIMVSSLSSLFLIQVVMFGLGIAGRRQVTAR